jgi:hypothetical protein
MDYVDLHDSHVKLHNVKSFVVPPKGMKKKPTRLFFHVFENIHYLACDIKEVSYNK